MSAIPDVLSQYRQALTMLVHDDLVNCYNHEVKYFDPLFGLLEGAQVKAMWRLKFLDYGDAFVETEDVTDEGDGYYKMKYRMRYKSSGNKMIMLNVQAYFKVQGNLITEQSEGFSVHAILKQERGLLGNLMGWNRFFQQSRKNKAKRALMDVMSKS